MYIMMKTHYYTIGVCDVSASLGSGDGGNLGGMEGHGTDTPGTVLSSSSEVDSQAFAPSSSGDVTDDLLLVWLRLNKRRLTTGEKADGLSLAVDDGSTPREARRGGRRNFWRIVSTAVRLPSCCVVSGCGKSPVDILLGLERASAEAEMRGGMPASLEIPMCLAAGIATPEFVARLRNVA